jgi:hypothetical protein
LVEKRRSHFFVTQNGVTKMGRVFNRFRKSRIKGDRSAVTFESFSQGMRA